MRSGDYYYGRCSINRMHTKSLYACSRGIYSVSRLLLPHYRLASKVRMSSGKPQVIFVLGGPGAGKGTQCAKLVQEFGYVHLSAGDLLRAARDSGSPDGRLISEYIKEGKIVPVEITIRLLEQAMNNNPIKKFLIDGFPRNEDNREGWERQMGDNAEVKMVLFFECPEEICLERVLSRGISSGRTDDNPESFKKRYCQYLTVTMPIVNTYEKRGLVKRISSVPPPDQVFEEVKRVLKND